MTVREAQQSVEAKGQEKESSPSLFEQCHAGTRTPSQAGDLQHRMTAAANKAGGEWHNRDINSMTKTLADVYARTGGTSAEFTKFGEMLNDQLKGDGFKVSTRPDELRIRSPLGADIQFKFGMELDCEKGTTRATAQAIY